MKKTPCLGCTERAIGCHAACLRYDEPGRMEGRVALAERVGVAESTQEYMRRKMTKQLRNSKRRRP